MSELILSTQLPMDQSPASVYLSNLSKSGRVTMQQSLSVIAEWITGNPDPFSVNWAAMRFQHTQALRTRLAETYKPATANKYLCAIRGTLKAAWKLGQMPTDEYHMAASVEGLKVETLPAGRALKPGEISALLHVCAADPTPAGARDAALIALLFAAGLRRAEIVTLNLDDYNRIDGELVVTGKGRKERIAHVLNGCSHAMSDWLDVRGEFAGSLFVPITKDGKLQERPMTTQAIFNMLRKRGKQAEVENFSPHDLRRTFISQMLDLGTDISTVSKMAGHKNVSTTARYDRRGEVAKRNAADKLFIPYRGR